MKRQTAMLAKFEVRLPIATMVVLLVLQTPLLMRAQGGQEGTHRAAHRLE